MLSSPYPIPSLRIWKAAMLIGWAAGVAAGVWVLVSPPKSYDGIGLALTIAWGIMLAAGSLLVTLGHVLRTYQIELPGLAFSLGGVVLYGYLSWEATLTDSPGSGPRACLMILLAALIIARLRVLLYIDRRGRRIVEMQEEIQA
ncbi:hypothetical protein Bra3105_06840 [Brachybacterium halotolerans subsp. kimchii]|uniref:hypothetical protein n=1 Tax=Brachybacterium halotolerans TaxID=2795215 RepID=UPI001E5F3D1B|nr:hypothetical protein [Brachybacterium halotolerans]UEJ84023.1 hypothetical protein Bra3105_06840 [Brachybacterium halotolerans subsp. kimchii]